MNKRNWLKGTLLQKFAYLGAIILLIYSPNKILSWIIFIMLFIGFYFEVEQDYNQYISKISFKNGGK